MNTEIAKNTATWEDYLSAFEHLLNSDNHSAPYTNPAYLDYVKLNHSRQKRWLKTGVLNQEIIAEVKKINIAQTWYIITEPWCGDAAHSIPFLKLISEHNPLITVKIVWRDTPPLLIEDYLTNGGKSVPKLVVRDAEENDLFTWGPRPEPCQKVYLEMKERNAPFEEQKVVLQNWYNTDKGLTLQKELLALIREMNRS
jgi:hypothetical protein